MEIGSFRGVGHAIFVRVFHAVAIHEIKLSRCCHAEERDASVECV